MNLAKLYGQQLDNVLREWMAAEKRRLPDDDERRYRAGWVDYVRQQAGCSLPQVDWREEWVKDDLLVERIAKMIGDQTYNHAPINYGIAEKAIEMVRQADNANG